MVCQSPSAVRAAAPRRRTLGRQAFSIGLKPRRSGGRSRRVAPAASTASRTCPRLCGEIVYHDDGAGPRVPDEHLADIGQPGGRSHRPGEQPGLGQ